METSFSAEQLADPQIKEAERNLRSCVHCGFCTATCPTYVLLGDELDSPRGRIYMIKDMLENNRPASAEITKHIDRCLSCLSCMTTCPSGVNYMHLVDHARQHIEKTYHRPLQERLLRAALAAILPYRSRFRFAMHLSGFAGVLASLLRDVKAASQLHAMLDLASRQNRNAARSVSSGVYKPLERKRKRVVLLSGCAQPVLSPSINDAAIRVLTRNGVEVVLAKGEGCCGSLVHHMGKEKRALELARHNIDIWSHEIESSDLDAILVTTSGCGTTIKDYGFMFRDDEAYAEKAKRVSSATKDITEFLADLPLTSTESVKRRTVAYQAACSLQHGQQIKDLPKKLLQKVGYEVRDVPESHLCCGSAGTYNILQPEISRKLRDRKIANILKVKPDIVASGNIGCITQLRMAPGVPIVHTVELIDWATGGPAPAVLGNA